MTSQKSAGLRERLVRSVRNVFRRVSVNSVACFHIVPNQSHLPQLTASEAIPVTDLCLKSTLEVNYDVALI